jgi:hypothetical protein
MLTSKRSVELVDFSSSGKFDAEMIQAQSINYVGIVIMPLLSLKQTLPRRNISHTI